MWFIIFESINKAIGISFLSGGLTFVAVYLAVGFVDNLIRRNFPRFWVKELNNMREYNGTRK